MYNQTKQFILVWNYLRMSISWQNFHYPFNIGCIAKIIWIRPDFNTLKINHLVQKHSYHLRLHFPARDGQILGTKKMVQEREISGDLIKNATRQFKTKSVCENKKQVPARSHQQAINHSAWFKNYSHSLILISKPKQSLCHSRVQVLHLFFCDISRVHRVQTTC